MAGLTEELVQIVRELPAEKAREVMDFARFLRQQAGDAAWDRIVEDTRPRPKLDSFIADALREGPAEPLDPSRL